MSIKKIGPNNYRLDFRDAFGRRRILTGLASKKEAEELLFAEKSKRRKGRHGISPKPVLYQTFRDEWLRRYKLIADSRGKTNTYQDYASIFRTHLDPIFTGIGLCDVTPKSIGNLIHDLQGNVFASRGAFLKPKTLRNILMLAQTFLRDAYFAKHTEENFAEMIKKPSSKPQKDYMPLTEGEVFRFLMACDGLYRTFFAICFYTGVRTGEALALQSKDFGEFSVKIERSLSRGVLTTPKTGNSRRVEIVEDLKKYLKGVEEKNGFLFKFDRNNLRNRVWAKTLRKIGLEYRDMYHTRHTFATMMLKRGYDILWVANQMGDNPQTVWSNYAKYRELNKGVLRKEFGT